MTRLKKVLSIVLCLSMLLGTLTVGLLSASAEDEEPSAAIPAYATLAQEAGDGDFFYAGYEFSLVDKPAEGDNPAVYKPIENGIIPGGSTLHVKYYVKTNKDLYHGKYFLVLSDKTLFPSISPVTKTVNPDVLSGNWSVKAVDSEAAGFAVYDPSEDVTVVNINNFTAEEIDKWLIIEMDDNEKAAKPKDAGSVDKPLFEFDVKLASGKSGEFDTVMIPDSYTAYTGRNNNTVGCQYIGGTKASNKTAVSGFQLQPSQHFKIANAVTFLADDGSVIETQFPAEGDDIVPPTVNNLYKWADAEGNFVDLSNVKMGNTPLTYTAVLNTTTVEVTLNGNGGLVDGAETKVVNAPVSQTLKLSQYSAEKEGDSFKGWSINGLIAENYTFGSLKPVEVNAVWENSAMIKVVVGKVTGEWVDFVDYVGTPGEALNADSFNSIVAAVEEEFAKTGRDTIDCEEEPVYAGLNSLEYLDGYGAYLNPVTAANCSSVVVGETSYLFVSTRFIQTVNYYYPNFDADGIAIEGSWDNYKTDTYAFANSIPVADYDPAQPDNLANIPCTYKYSGMTAYDSNRVGTGAVSIDSIRKFEDDEEAKLLYTSIFKDGQGNELTPDANNKLSLRPSGYTEPGVFDLYTCPQEKVYRFAFNADAGSGINYQIIDKEFKIGDTLTKADLSSCYRLENSATKYDANDLLEDCAVIERPGYRLVDIWFGSEESTEETSIFSGNTVTIDKDLIESKLRLIGGKVDGIELSASFEESEYEFTVLYQKADGTWDELTTKSFKGKTQILYADLVDSELEEIINENCPEGFVLDKSAFTVESTGASKSSFYAYEGPLTIKINYMSDQRSAFIDYNNGKDGEHVGYEVLDTVYGTVLYDPDYDPDAEAEEGSAKQMPFFNRYYLSGLSNFVSKTVKQQKTDEDGNPIYEPLYENVVDEEGNVVLDPITGEPEQKRVYEDVLDDEGNPVIDEATGKPKQQPAFDKNKPVYSDPKGETVARPYRNCEYVGTKIYHLDTAVRNWSDMPAESEWKDGYENDEYRLYTTTILQVQWKSDADFLFRVYDTDGFSIGLPIIGDGFSLNMNGNIYSALGKDFKWYYWKDNRPCSKGEGTLNTKPGLQIILLLWPKKETLELGTDENGNPITSTGWYFSALPLATTWFKPSFIPDLIPTILPLLKGLLF